jgi:ELWxxDGT repeat protein
MLIMVSAAALSAGAQTLVKDIVPGTSSSNPSELAAFNGKLFFNANDGINGEQLWKSDGTEAGTVLVKAFPNQGGPSKLTDANGVLFYVNSKGDKELRKSDGTEAGTVLVKDIRASGSSSPELLVNVKGTLFFTADDGVHGRELWKSDGTEAGTVMVKDILTGPGTSEILSMVSANGTLFLVANDSVHGVELWKSDGTEAGTVIVKEIKTGATGSSVSNLKVLNNTFYFTAADETRPNGGVLYKSDGTDAGTVPVKDNAGNSYVSISNLTFAMGKFFFTKDNVLYASSDLVVPATTLKSITPTDVARRPRNFVATKDHLFFINQPAASANYDLWRTDGTEAGTILLKGGVIPVNVEPKATGNANTFYFAGYDSVAFIRLWKSDGTAEGTQKIENSFSTPTNLTDVNGLIFYAGFSSGKELCKYEPGTTQVARFESKHNSGISHYLKAGKLHISLPSSAFATARLSDLRGTTVRKIILQSSENEISINDLPNALYLLKVTTPSGSLVQKINLPGPRN